MVKSCRRMLTTFGLAPTRFTWHISLKQVSLRDPKACEILKCNQLRCESLGEAPQESNNSDTYNPVPPASCNHFTQFLSSVTNQFICWILIQNGEKSRLKHACSQFPCNNCCSIGWESSHQCRTYSCI